MPVTKIASRWDSGALVFHDKGDYGVGAEVLRIAQATVTIGTATNSVDLSVFGSMVSTYAGGTALDIQITAGDTDALFGIRLQNTFTRSAGGSFKGISSELIYTPSGGGYAGMYATGGKVTLGEDLTTGITYMWGVQGQIDLGSGRTINNASTVLAGLRGVITGDTTIDTAVEGVSCLYLDNLNTADLDAFSGGRSSFIKMHNAGGLMDAGFTIFAGNKVPVLFYFEACGTMVVAGAAKSGTSANIAIDWEGATYYINMKQV